mmetsp:Transcript_29032/g.88733  ORF Transcript_29032/g.88733 Transcript_29032/m.88733 type:complete len:831 (-) Transcript_29032:4181-6673(-)
MHGVNVQNYTVLDGEVYDLRVMRNRHPGGQMALHHAGNRDLSSSWAAIHLFGSRSRLQVWLKAMRVEDKVVRATVLASVAREPYVKSSALLSAFALSLEWWRGAKPKSREDRARFDIAEDNTEENMCPYRRKKCKEHPPETFDEDLTRRVRAFFEREAAANGVSVASATKANGLRWLWMATLLFVTLVAYAEWAGGRHVFACVVMPVFGQLVAFSVMHDASHSAISTRRWVNVLGSYCGWTWTSPHEWLMQHVLAHHLQPNIYGEDPDVVHVDRYRNVRQSAVPFYATVVWLVALPVGLTTLAPLRVFRDGCYPASTATAPKWTKNAAKIVLHFLGRTVYVLAFIVAPAANISSRSLVPAGTSSSTTTTSILQSSSEFAHSFTFCSKALAWITVPQVLGSVIFMAVTQIAHLMQTTYEDAANVKVVSWYEHQIRTACNYAAESEVHGLLTGGLNLQIEHHLFPTVNHCHLLRIRPIVKSACREWRMPYMEVSSMTAGLMKHMRFLCKLARRDPVATIFFGQAWHVRAPIADKPKHRFKQEHAMWVLNIDDPDSLPDTFPLSFDSRDHLRSFQREHGSFTSPKALADAVRTIVKESLKGSEFTIEGGHIEILTMPRYFGYTFNPISVFFIYDRSSKLTSVVFEVSNTPWHEEILYTHCISEAENGIGAEDVFVFHDVTRLHVSPFQPVRQECEWRVVPPAKGTLEIVVKVSRDGIHFFEAGFRAQLEPHLKVSFSERWRLATRIFPQRALVRIHIHSASLLAMGAQFYSHKKKTPLSDTIEIVYHERYNIFAFCFSTWFLEAFTLTLAATVIVALRMYHMLSTHEPRHTII